MIVSDRHPEFHAELTAFVIENAGNDTVIRQADSVNENEYIAFLKEPSKPHVGLLHIRPFEMAEWKDKAKLAIKQMDQE